MKFTGQQSETNTMDADVEVVGGGARVDTSISSSSDDEYDSDNVSHAISEQHNNLQVHKEDVEHTLSGTIPISFSSKPITTMPEESNAAITAGTSAGESNTLRATSTRLATGEPASHVQNSSQNETVKSSDCDTESSAPGGTGLVYCQRSYSLPTRKKQSAARINFGDSGEITTIREFTAERSNTVGGVLHFCKRRVLFPYLKLLGLMGLKPLYSDGNDTSLLPLVLSKIYLVLVGLVLLMGYGLQFIACFRRDHGFAYRKDFLSPPTSLTESYKNIQSSSKRINATHVGLLRADNFDTNYEKWLMENMICTGNVIYVYGIPSILHFVSFLYMVHLYWVNDDEHLQNLMERVFIQASHANINEFSQRRLIRRLQGLVCIGCIWIVIITCCQILQVFFHKIYVNFWIEVDNNVTNGISAFLLFSTLWQDAIQVTIVISFAIQCNLICTYTELIRARLMQHSISLSDCMKELGELGQLLSYLNEDLATGLAPLIIIDGIYASGAIIHLIQNGKNISLPFLILLIIASMLWIFIIAFPLAQAARVSTCCQNLKDMGHIVRIRPFGYQYVIQSDLDSFLLFVSNLNLKSRILKIPITSSILSTFAIALSVTVFFCGYFQ